jgi:two-component system nitrate/nitrite response regulator NarL
VTARGRDDRLALAVDSGLTDRQLQVLEGMAAGLTNQQIADDLDLSEDTVKTHARHLFAKTGAADRANAVAIGFRNRWLA